MTEPINYAWSLLKEEPYQGLTLDDFDPQKVTGEVTDVNSPLATQKPLSSLSDKNYYKDSQWQISKMGD